MQLFSFAPHIVIVLQKLQKQKLSLLTSLHRQHLKLARIILVHTKFEMILVHYQNVNLIRKCENFGFSDQERKQEKKKAERSRSITVKGAIIKSLILLLQ